MKKFALAATTALVAATGANAGGIDRSGQFLGPLFEEGGETGGYVAFSFGNINPAANGTDTVTSQNYDPLENYQAMGLAVKQDLSENMSFAFIVDEPFGADVGYTSGVYNGGGANVGSTAMTGVLRYKFNENFSVHGGLRAQKIGGVINTSFSDGAGGTTPHSLTAESDLDFGYLVGVAYERPDIALRVALTYSSEIENGLSGTEISLPAGSLPSFAPTTFTITSPATYNLEFQTGVAADTLLFGSLRYAEWEGYNLTTSTGNEYVSFGSNTTTYSIGLGRRLNEQWAVAATFGYEEEGSKPGGTPLAPTTGTTSIGLGATYTSGNMKVSGGITYAMLGDQYFDIRSPVDGSVIGRSEFTDNTAIGAGIRVGFNF